MSGRGQKRPVWPNQPSPNCWAKPMRCRSAVGPLGISAGTALYQVERRRKASNQPNRLSALSVHAPVYNTFNMQWHLKQHPTLDSFGLQRIILGVMRQPRSHMRSGFLWPAHLLICQLLICQRPRASSRTASRCALVGGGRLPLRPNANAASAMMIHVQWKASPAASTYPPGICPMVARARNS